MKTEFEQEVLSLRVDKDSFKNDMDSPIPRNERPNFKGLNYFPPDRGYRVTSKLERFDTPKPTMIATSTGTRKAYLRYGVITFGIKGRDLRLIVYKSAEDPYARSLFIPFSDETSGRETYAAGRYLDLEGQVTITNWTLTRLTNPIVLMASNIRVQFLPSKTSFLLRFSPERRITNRMS